MTDRDKFSKIRQEIVNSIRADLMGPQSDEEILDENPRSSYIVGILSPQKEENKQQTVIGDQEVEATIAYGDDENYIAGEDDDNEPVTVTHFMLPSSIGISFYVRKELSSICVDITWGDYVKTKISVTDKDGKEKDKTCYKRIPMKDTISVDFNETGRSKEYQLIKDSNLRLHISTITLKRGFRLVTTYFVNKRSNVNDELESLVFQPEIKAYALDGGFVFYAEHICRDVLSADEFYFEQRPVIGRGRGCAATWEHVVDGRADYVKSDFIPQYEYPGVSAALDGFDPFFFSMRFMAVKSKKKKLLGN